MNKLPFNLPREFNYRIERELMYGSTWYTAFILVGRDGAIHFHYTDYGADRNEVYKERFRGGGVEVHHASCPTYMNKPPDHPQCRILARPCWHNGSSMAGEGMANLYLREDYNGNVSEDISGIFFDLIRTYNNTFNTNTDDNE